MSLLYIGLFYANDSGGIRATDNSFDNTAAIVIHAAQRA